MRKLSAIISDEFLISKEKIEMPLQFAGWFNVRPCWRVSELQGILGGYFAESQGFEKDKLSCCWTLPAYRMDSKFQKNHTVLLYL